MPIYALGDRVPKIDPEAFIHPMATIIGDVTIGPESSVWPSAVIRGDHDTIVIGARTSIQDGTVVHTAHGIPTTVGDEVVVGHLVHLEGCTIESNSLVGSNSVVLHGAIVRSGALVAASAFVPNGMEVPSGAMALGVPAKIKLNAVTNPEVMFSGVGIYVNNSHWYREELRQIG